MAYTPTIYMLSSPPTTWPVHTSGIVRASYSPAARGILAARVVSVYLEFLGGTVDTGTWSVFLNGVRFISRMNTTTNNNDRTTYFGLDLVLRDTDLIELQSISSAGNVRFAASVIVEEQ